MTMAVLTQETREATSTITLCTEVLTMDLVDSLDQHVVLVYLKSRE
jgi:hypothetical protein